uniref:Uncharacterized protein n=1 Tax=Anguilla anguilla TaxID=7936 RepID=A0A0E9UCC2_ANGAN
MQQRDALYCILRFEVARSQLC